MAPGSRFHAPEVASLSSRSLISDGPPYSFAHAGANPNRARTASRLLSSPSTTAKHRLGRGDVRAPQRTFGDPRFDRDVEPAHDDVGVAERCWCSCRTYKDLDANIDLINRLFKGFFAFWCAAVSALSGLCAGICSGPRPPRHPRFGEDRLPVVLDGWLVEHHPRRGGQQVRVLGRKARFLRRCRRRDSNPHRWLPSPRQDERPCHACRFAGWLELTVVVRPGLDNPRVRVGGADCPEVRVRSPLRSEGVGSRKVRPGQAQRLDRDDRANVRLARRCAWQRRAARTSTAILGSRAADVGRSLGGREHALAVGSPDGQGSGSRGWPHGLAGKMLPGAEACQPRRPEPFD